MILLIPSEPKSLAVMKTKYKASLETGLSFVFSKMLCLCLFTVNVKCDWSTLPPQPRSTPGNRFQHLLLRTKHLVHAVSRDGIIRKVLQGRRGFRRRRCRFWARAHSPVSLEYFISMECDCLAVEVGLQRWNGNNQHGQQGRARRMLCAERVMIRRDNPTRIVRLD